MNDDYMVTVCDACFTAACWQGEFYCDSSKTAGVVKKSIKELRKLNLEHPEYWENDFNCHEAKTI